MKDKTSSSGGRPNPITPQQVAEYGVDNDYSRGSIVWAMRHQCGVDGVTAGHIIDDEVTRPLPAHLATPQAIARLCLMVGYDHDGIARGLAENYDLDAVAAGRIVDDEAAKL